MAKGTLFDGPGGPSGMSLPGLTGIDPVLRGALTYWAALALAALTILGCYLLMRGRTARCSEPSSSTPSNNYSPATAPGT
ncbi:hypothetical protein [Arthrobacter sp.]|uniref:hypothetical protein n=1 Tax=Arthrobacter sp. TaxID=1667 RepID=UPI00339111E2